MGHVETRWQLATCPGCNQNLERQDASLTCPGCGEQIPLTDGIARFPVAAAPDSAASVYDALSPIYETPLWFPTMYRAIGGPFAPADDRRLVRRMIDEPGETMLDVACGTGRFTRYIASDVDMLWGIDLADGMLERAKQSIEQRGIENVSLARMDATNLSFDSDTFDTVSCCWALHLFPALSPPLTEIQRVLRSGGRFVGTTVIDEYVLGFPGLKLGMEETIGGQPLEREQFRELLTACGFESIGFERRGSALFFGASVPA